eukprot:203825_1
MKSQEKEDILRTYNIRRCNSPKECICGEPLIKVNDKRFRIDYVGSCKVCNKIHPAESSFWHCNNNDFTNAIHIDGFNVCNDCINTYDPTLIPSNHQQSSIQSITFLEKIKYEILCYGFIKSHYSTKHWPNELSTLCSLYIRNVFIPIKSNVIEKLGLKSIVEKITELASPRFDETVKKWKQRYNLDIDESTAATLIFGPADNYRELIAKHIATLYELDYCKISATRILEEYNLNQEENRRYFENIWSNLEITAKSKNKGCVLFLGDLDAIYFDTEQNSLKHFLLHFFLNHLYNNYRSDERHVFVIASINNINMFDSWLALNKMDLFCLDSPNTNSTISLFRYLLNYPSIIYKIDKSIDFELVAKQMFLYSRSDIETFVHTLKMQCKFTNRHITNEKIRKLLDVFKPTLTEEQFWKCQEQINEIKRYRLV